MRRHVADESVDLVYLVRPLDSNQSYNLLFQRTGCSAVTGQASMSDPVLMTKTTVPYRSRNDPPVHPVTMHNDTVQPDRTDP